MRNFLLGTLTGAGLIAAGLGINSLVSAQHDEYDEDGTFHMALSGGSPNEGTNLKLEKKRPDLEWDYIKVTRDNYPAMQVDLLAPLMTLTRSDIESLCIDPYAGNDENQASYTVDIDLVPEAKAKLGLALAPHDNEEVAIRLLGQPINMFFADSEKARLFAADEDTMDNRLTSDISFSFNHSATHITLVLISSLTGKAEIAACEASFNIESMPGYQTHKKRWQDMAARVARGESWMPQIE